MVRKASGTREKLVRAAEEVFAAQGVDGAQLRDITRLAGQANPSAVQYHFGSRAGLLDAVMAERQERTEAVLAAGPAARHLDGGAGTAGDGESLLRELLGALIAAEASELATEPGRRCLCISAQLSHESGVRTRVPHPTLAGTRYWEVIGRIEECLAALPEPLRLERLDLALTLVGAALADRARQYLAGATPLTGERLFLADLVETTASLLRATVPAAGRTAS
ncbi:TetR family transcriptional regulator [Streptomyces sp. WA1-19]|uniref:TetR/AcrR family transcriptional regulator n=1 Tax=Streptomyces sp. WA1-19 TaxID=2884220 RepID=UPI001D040953|nr:TetR/AcrR family transcriptional regulator [Streptomyces sp. WA1-19]UDF09575.1 TetR family transcriptional regulator [Streptomyces sp. WA1-19]